MLCTIRNRLTRVAGYRFRGDPYESLPGRAIRMLAGEAWEKTSSERKDEVALFTGKSANGEPIEGHQHALLRALVPSRATRKAARLLAWRRTPFSHEEQEALLAVAEEPMSLGYNESSKDPWRVHLVPLDSAVKPPSGFVPGQQFTTWKTMTPFVPPQHIYDRHGNEKPGKSVKAQVLREAAEPRISH